jgi:hypothetical protein
MIKKIKFAPMKTCLLGLFILFTLFYGCKTDFDVIAPYKEVIVIDGLLNPLDSVQYVRISKAFLGEGNAITMAQQKDSINYADVLDVKMERLSQNQVVETFALNRSELNDKDSGLFAYPFHVLYTTNHPLLLNGSNYRIRVTNRQTGTEATSLTQVVLPMNVTSPNPNQDSIDFTGNAPSIIRFTPGQYSRLIDLLIRFHYREIDPSGNSVEKSIDMNFSDKPISTTSQEIIYYLYKYEWFQNIGNNIPDKPGYIRRIDSLSAGLKPIEVICMAGSEDLRTYIQLQQPSTGIVQELPSFTTVENGLGLFTSRIIKSVFR